MTGPVPDTTRLAAASLAAGDPTGWFEQLYAEAGAGTAEVPWDVPRPSSLLIEWARTGAVVGGGRSALVVGCGLGRDAEFLAALGFVTTGFDIAATAVRTARERHPDSPVEYVVADLLDPPASWRGGFDLVVESNNVQALPKPARDRAIANVGPLVAPGGTLLVVAVAAIGTGTAVAADAAAATGAGAATDDTAAAAAAATTGADAGGPPWPLTRAEINAFAGPGLTPVLVAELTDAGDPLIRRWRAEFRAAG
ncbi:class I SAM-dependent methyltransferase [Actinoplanes sp. NPDC049599]|uniref:class I SAM-dependent methyltransferase n=1 Tax=Actinoplanes sp. NPDC049599 TaxID=3363903 RepID=UPI0037A5E78D